MKHKIPFCQILAFLTCGIFLSCKEDKSEFQIAQLTEEEYLAAAELSDEIQGTTIPNDEIADLPLAEICKMDGDVRSILEVIEEAKVEEDSVEYSHLLEFGYGIRTYSPSFPYVEIFFYHPTAEFSYLIYKDDEGKWAVVPERFESCIFKVSKSGYIASALETNDACFIDMNFHKAELENDNLLEIKKLGRFTTLKELRKDFDMFYWFIVDDGFWLGDDYYLKCYRYEEVEETQYRYFRFSGIGDMPKTQIHINPSGKYYAVVDKSRTITITKNKFLYQSTKARKFGYTSDTLAFCVFDYTGWKNEYRIWTQDKYSDLLWNKEARKRLLRNENSYDSTLTDKIRVVFDMPCDYRVKATIINNKDKADRTYEKVFTSQRDTIYIPSTVREFTYQIDLAEEIKSVYKDGKHFSPTSDKRTVFVSGNKNSCYIYPYWLTNEYFEQENIHYDTLKIESGKLFWRGEVFKK